MSMNRIIKQVVGWILLLNMFPLLCIIAYFISDRLHHTIWEFYLIGWVVNLVITLFMLLLGIILILLED